MGRFLIGIIFGFILAPVGVMIYLAYGKPPVAVADPPFPQEERFTGIPLHARIDKEMIQRPPIQPDEATLVAGAVIYADKCAVCHGFHGKPAPIGDNMFPSAPPLWEKHRNGNAVGVSDDAPGETYWKVANGIRLTGMPDFKTQLTDTQMWQVSLLLANADKPLPPQALNILRNETVPGSSTFVAQPKAADDSGAAPQ